MKNNIQIYVIAHNSEDIRKIKEDGTYVPLFVGCDGGDNFGFLSDDSGDNISYKNPFYSELTGLYWIWKNSDAEVIGLVHYRRYFSNWAFNHILNKEDCEKILNDYDIILPKKNKVFLDTLYDEYDHWHHIEDLELCGKLIKEKFPDYYVSFENVMNGNEMHCFNMFIAPKRIMDSYCNWLFSILFELEKKNTYVNLYDDYQKRIYGFLAERLFNVWLEKHDLKIKECEVKHLSIRFNFVRNFLRKVIVNIAPLRKFFVKYIMNKLF